MSFGLDSEASLQPVSRLIENRVSLLTLKLPAFNRSDFYFSTFFEFVES